MSCASGKLAKSFWKLFKHSVRGTHIHISGKYMDSSFGEFAFRSNHLPLPLPYQPAYHMSRRSA
jgi:hypothetical protein